VAAEKASNESSATDSCGSASTFWGLGHIAPVEDQDGPRLKVPAQRPVDLVRLAGVENRPVGLDGLANFHRTLGRGVGRSLG
jgi:hypothetical protein